MSTRDKKRKRVEFATENTVFVYEQERDGSEDFAPHELNFVSRQTIDIAKDIISEMRSKKIFDSTVEGAPDGWKEDDILAHVFKKEVKKLRLGPLRRGQLLSSARLFFNAHFWANKEDFSDVSDFFEDQIKQNYVSQTGIFLRPMTQALND